MIRPFLLAGLCALAAAIAWLPPASAQGVAAAEIVRYPGRGDPGDHRGEFANELLSLVLSRADGRWRLQVVDGMPQPRRAQALRDGLVDVATLPMVAEREPGLRPIRHPLQRGLLGVRLLVTTPERADALMTIASMRELKRDFVMGYGQTWMDRDTLARLGFRIETASTYTGLFDMLRAGRFDYVARGVGELSSELANPRLAGHGLVVVPGIALYYPLDHYFFVAADRPDLARALERGFRRVLADGSYAALFQAHFGNAMADAKLEQRSILHVFGYPVPPGTPLEEFDVLGLVRSQGVFVPPSSDAPLP